MKQDDPIEFGITTVKLTESSVLVEGRCHRGPILLDSTFTVLSKMTVQTTTQSCGATELQHVAPVNLKVDSIWAYGHEIKELSQSMTARLELSGTGIEHLQPDLVLSK